MAPSGAVFKKKNASVADQGQGVTEHSVALFLELVISNLVCPNSSRNSFARLGCFPEFAVSGL